MTGISAVIATYKRKDELKKLFDSFILSDIDFLELIIVDQNEDNLIDELISTYSVLLDIKHLKFLKKHNSKARNFGAIIAKNPIICFPDDDCWFDPDSLNKILLFYQYNHNVDLLITRWNQNPAYQLKSLLITQKMIFSFKAPMGYAAITLFFKKEAFFDLGSFDEIFGIGGYIGGGEEAELIFRAAKANKVVFYNHTIGVNHLYKPLQNRSLSIIRSRQRGVGLIYSKYNLGPFVVIRGMFSTLVKMIFSFNLKTGKKYYYMLLGCLEGYFYKIK